MYELLFPNISENMVKFLDVVSNIIEVLLFVVMVIGEWHLLKKFNDKPWKALIPVYNVYTIFKHTWKKSAFWVFMGSFIGFSLLFGVSEAIVQLNSANVWGDILLVLSLPFMIVLAIYTLLSNFRIAEAFGKGKLYGLALTVFYEIMILVLGLNKLECVYDNARTAEVAEGADQIPEKETVE